MVRDRPWRDCDCIIVYLKSVYYQGTESEWLKIQIDSSGNEVLEKLIEYYEEVK